MSAPKGRPDELRRTVSQALKTIRSREEQETLLGDDEEQADGEGCVGLSDQIFYTPNPHSKLLVYRNIHRIRRLVLATIEDPYTIEQLRSVRINVTVLRPLTDRLYDPNDVSIVYCLLVNRNQFLHERAKRPHDLTINGTRAGLCELLATRILRRFDEDNPSRRGLLLLANVLVAGFDPFQNAPSEVLDNDSVHMTESDERYRSGYERTLTALEIAIITESKIFLSSHSVQKIIEAVYIGRIIYTPNAFLDIIPDHYKHRPISLYDPRRADLLNQYRLVVPRTRNIIEVVQFVVLLALFILTLANRNDNLFTLWELCFMVYGAGWCLDEIASVLEHGWKVHTQNMWAFFDISFLFIYFIYITMRLQARLSGHVELGRQALDVLSLAAPILLPRLAFNLMPDNILFVALRAMMGDFIFLTVLAFWCFAGFLLAMNWLSRWGSSEPNVDLDVIRIGKWMLWIWFGLDGTGIQRSTEFHRILGPIMMVLFAFLGNTLFLTILVSMLSNTFAKIVTDSAAEIQFRKAVLTFEGVKSDAIFAYRPPTNILAVLILLPLKPLLTPRWFHKVHITAVRVLNFPLLLAITWYERRNLWASMPRADPDGPSRRRRKSVWWQPWTWGDAFSAHGDIKTVFEVEPPQDMVDEIEEEDMLGEEDLWSSAAAPSSGLKRWSGDGFRRSSMSEAEDGGPRSAMSARNDNRSASDRAGRRANSTSSNGGWRESSGPAVKWSDGGDDDVS